MAAFVTNLSLDRGSTFRKQFKWSVGQRKQTAVPVDLTGCTVETQFTKDGVVFKTINQDSGGMALGGVDGTISYYISHVDTAAWPHETSDYVTTITFSNGDVYRKVKGSVYAPAN